MLLERKVFSHIEIRQLGRLKDICLGSEKWGQGDVYIHHASGDSEGCLAQMDIQTGLNMSSYHFPILKKIPPLQIVI